MSHQLSLQCFFDAQKDAQVEPERYEDLAALVDLFSLHKAPASVPVPERYPHSEQVPHLIIVEDETLMADLIQEKLAAWGYPEAAIFVFSSGEQAVDYVQRNRVGIAIVDIKLSNPLAIRGVYTSGLQVIRAIKEGSPEAKVFLISGFATYQMVRQAILELGASYFFKKPFRLADILGAVHWASEQIATGSGAEQAASAVEQVLVVDDDLALAEGIAMALRSFGYQATAVGGGPQALEAFEAVRYDAVLLDVRMPVMDGMEVLRRLRHRYADLIVVMLTAVADQQIASEAMQLNAHEFLLKPCDLELLQFTLEHAFAQRQAGGG